MSFNRLGRTDEARTCLGKAAQWMKTVQNGAAIQWMERVETTQLRLQAESILNSAGR
jgi:hypothetical protein